MLNYIKLYVFLYNIVLLDYVETFVLLVTKICNQHISSYGVTMLVCKLSVNEGC
jgi:hypothetical protein